MQGNKKCGGKEKEPKKAGKSGRGVRERYMQVMREDYPRDFIDDEYPDMLWDENPDER